MGYILSRFDFSDLESKSLEYFLESDLDAWGSALTEEQKAEAKELYRVLFLVLQHPDALKTLSFDEITKKKARRCIKHVRLEDDSTICLSDLGEERVPPQYKDRERIIKDTHSNGYFRMRHTLEMIQRTFGGQTCRNKCKPLSKSVICSNGMQNRNHSL